MLTRAPSGPASPTSALAGRSVISLRPVGGHASIRRAAASHGAQVISLSPWRLAFGDDATTRSNLRTALDAPRVIVTSPAAARAAAALQALRVQEGQRWFAVGSGTAAALRRAGIRDVTSPTRMDSEGLLDVPGLQDVDGTHVGLLTAPGGRDRITTVLCERGARLLRADVYARVDAMPTATAVGRLRALAGRPWLALSSGQALERILDILPGDARALLLRARVAAASERLVSLASQRGFADVTLATDARPASLLSAMRSASIR